MKQLSSEFLISVTFLQQILSHERKFLVAIAKTFTIWHHRERELLMLLLLQPHWIPHRLIILQVALGQHIKTHVGPIKSVCWPCLMMSHVPLASHHIQMGHRLSLDDDEIIQSIALEFSKNLHSLDSLSSFPMDSVVVVAVGSLVVGNHLDSSSKQTNSFASVELFADGLQAWAQLDELV